MYRNNWNVNENTVYWCNLKLSQGKGLQFHQTRSHAIALCNTLLAICTEKVVQMKTGEEFYCKIYQSPRLPRFVLTPNSRHKRQDPHNPYARTSTDHQSEQRLYRETCRSLLEDTRREHPGESHRCLYREVMLTTQFQENLTQPFRKWTQIAEKQSKY